jgi:hypothetical protein
MARRTATSYRRTTVTTDPGAADTGDPQDPARTVVVEDRSLGLAEALSIVTTLMLVAAILVLDAYLGKRYGRGIFF